MASLILASPEFAITSINTQGKIPNQFLSRTTSPRKNTNFRISEDYKEKADESKWMIRCLSTKYCEVRVSETGQNLKISRQFSAPVKESSSSSSKQNKDDEEKQNFYVNTGYAIRCIREEFPQIFFREVNFDIYRDDIVFKDPLNTFAGIENYKSIFSALRFHGRIFFKALRIDIISVSQPLDRVIMVRWTIHGIPRVPWESQGRFDGTSEYKLDKHGKIFEHRVDNIALNSPPKFRILAVENLIQSLGSHSTARPTYFEILSSSIIRSMPFIVSFTWVRFYLAFKLALFWRCASDS